MNERLNFVGLSTYEDVRSALQGAINIGVGTLGLRNPRKNKPKFDPPAPLFFTGGVDDNYYLLVHGEFILPPNLTFLPHCAILPVSINNQTKRILFLGGRDHDEANNWFSSEGPNELVMARFEEALESGDVDYVVTSIEPSRGGRWYARRLAANVKRYSSLSITWFYPATERKRETVDNLVLIGLEPRGTWTEK